MHEPTEILSDKNRQEPMGIQSDKDPQNGNRLSIDGVLSKIGDFGKFQKLLTVILFIVCLPMSYQTLLLYFATIVPSWKCLNNSSSCSMNGTMSSDDSRRCHMPRSEWEYTESTRFSLATQFDLHCEDEWMLHLASSMMFIGWGFGALFLGWLGDRFGRMSIFYPSVTVVLVVGLSSAFVTDIYEVMICRFIIGLFKPGTHLQAFILISEYVGNKHRPLVGLIIYLSNPIGWCILTLKAYLIKDWKILFIVCTAPYCFIYGFYVFIPESIKWLHFHGRKEKVQAIIRKVSAWNGKELQTDFEIIPPDNVEERKVNPLDLFRPSRRALLSLVQALLWMTIATCYYGLHMAADDLGGSAYRDFLILNVVEIPALFLAVFFCDYFGRKRTVLSTSFLGSVICVVIAFMAYASLKEAKTVLGMCGHFFITISFNAIYPWSHELYPIHIRNEGMAFLEILAHWGVASAPWIVKGLKPYGKLYPFVTLGLPTLFATVVALWLRETKERHIPQSTTIYNGNTETKETRAADETQFSTIVNKQVETYSRDGDLVQFKQINDNNV